MGTRRRRFALGAVAAGAVAAAATFTVSHQSYRVITSPETVQYSKGPPITFMPVKVVCTSGTLPARFDMKRQVFTTTGCPEIDIFKNGME